ncbi:ATP-binding cassette domain-containing protein [Streptomyces sp. P38-E01]|uniref:ATP-binding cassette domain-containing protein n=1 Tax=Streptomyces tardus TaxID=2780544 RepID=A0A949N3L1_9ACTN|nr:ATP-binding cassette domain-containing protein [Streptomyces tardus]MBU7596974.1 ATP-binding cassette domain-containing protein [Streptomyces tardus]
MPIVLESCDFAYKRRRPVLKRFTCELPPGRTVFLGPNGAGKSTVLGLAASALLPRAGAVTYDGLRTSARADRDGFRRRVAWLPQHVRPVPGLTAREQVAYAGWLKGMPRPVAWREALRALRLVELADSAETRVGELSGGQQRRVGVAQSLVHGAEVLLLDEPTAGMDPRQRAVFHEILAGLPSSVHVVLSTHDTADLDGRYHHVLVLNSGQLTFRGTSEAFLAHAEPGTAPGRAADSAYQRLAEREGTAWTV